MIDAWVANRDRTEWVPLSRVVKFRVAEPGNPDSHHPDWSVIAELEGGGWITLWVVPEDYGGNDEDARDYAQTRLGELMKKVAVVMGMDAL